MDIQKTEEHDGGSFEGIGDRMPLEADLVQYCEVEERIQ